MMMLLPEKKCDIPGNKGVNYRPHNFLFCDLKNDNDRCSSSNINYTIILSAITVSNNS